MSNKRFERLFVPHDGAEDPHPPVRSGHTVPVTPEMLNNALRKLSRARHYRETLNLVRDLALRFKYVGSDHIRVWFPEYHVMYEEGRDIRAAMTQRLARLARDGWIVQEPLRDPTRPNARFVYQLGALGAYFVESEGAPPRWYRKGAPRAHMDKRLEHWLQLVETYVLLWEFAAIAPFSLTQFDTELHFPYWNGTTTGTAFKPDFMAQLAWEYADDEADMFSFFGEIDRATESPSKVIAYKMRAVQEFYKSRQWMFGHRPLEYFFIVPDKTRMRILAGRDDDNLGEPPTNEDSGWFLIPLGPWREKGMWSLRDWHIRYSPKSHADYQNWPILREMIQRTWDIRFHNGSFIDGPIIN